MIDIKLDTSGLTAMADELQRLDLAPAISRALNRTGDQAVTQVGRTLGTPAAKAIALVPPSTSALRGR